jgi:hypothetical protein
MRGIFLNWIIVLFFAGARSEVTAQPLAFSQQYYATPSWEASMAVADLNGDGKLDIVTANSYANSLNSCSINIFTNDGMGNLSSNAIFEIAPNPCCVVAADLFGRGKKDLVVSFIGQTINPPGINNAYITIFTNNGAGVYGSNATYLTANDWGDFGGNCVAADLNGDGRPDLAVLNYDFFNRASTLTILTNNGSGGFGLSAAINPGVGAQYVQAADVNGDGNVDLITADTYNSLTIFTNNGFGVFGLHSVLNTSNNLTSFTVADVNGDGSPDLITGDIYYNSGSYSYSLSILTNDSTGAFSLSATIPVGNKSYFVLAADLNGDGSTDLVSLNSSGLTVLTNNGFGNFGYNTTILVDNGPGVGLAADLNYDGKMDLVVNTESGQFSRFTVLTQVPFVPPVLHIQNARTNTLLSWSCYSSDFLVQTNPDLNTSNWVDCGYPVATSLDYTNFSLSLTSAPADKLFFRLKQ